MPPDFREQLKSAAGQLTAAQIAEATGASKRTVESWRQARRTPKAREQAALLTRIRRAAARAERKQARAMQAPNVAVREPTND